MASRAVAIVAVAIALVVVAGDVNAQGTTVVAVCVSPPEEVTDSRVKGEMYVWRASIVSALVTELRTSADVCSAVMSFGFWTGSRPMIDYILTERVGCYIAGEFTKDDLAEIYFQRWHAELDLRSLKTIMQMEMALLKMPYSQLNKQGLQQSKIRDPLSFTLSFKSQHIY